MKIDKNIPIPNNTKIHKYPFHLMEIGDSIGLQTKDEARSARNSAYLWAKRNNLINKFTYLKVKEDKFNYRMWRIK
jgi:hypothetical protein